MGVSPPSAGAAALQLYHSFDFLAPVLIGVALLAVGCYLSLLLAEIFVNEVPPKVSSQRLPASAVPEDKTNVSAGEIRLAHAAKGVNENILEMPSPQSPATHPIRVRKRGA